MSTERNLYTYNNSSQYLPSYPPRPDQSYDDLKPPIEDDIIDSYSFSDVPSPQQTHYEGRSPHPAYLSPHETMPPHWPAHPIDRNPSFTKARSLATDVESVTLDGSGRMDYTLPASKEVPETRGLWATLLPDSMACRLYVLTVLIETCIDIAIEADLLLRVRGLDGDLEVTRLPVYLSIFVFAHLFQFVMAIDAVHAQNTLQFLFLTVFNALFLLYAVIQVSEIRQGLVTGTGTSSGITDIPVNVLTTMIPIVIAVAEVAYIGLGWKIWREFGWKVYKRLGADRQIKRMYAHYQIFVCLVKFDVFFFAGFTVQLMLFVLVKKDWQWYVTCAAIPFSLLLLADGMLAAKYESRIMMSTFMLGCAGAMVYFVYKLFRILTNRDTLSGVVKSLAVFAVIAIALLVVTFIFACIVMNNFGGGLKYQMSRTKHQRAPSLRRRGTEHQHRHQSYPLGFNPNRMSID